MTAEAAATEVAPGVAEHEEPTPRPLGRARRVLLALLVALVVAAALTARLGLVGDDAVGAADNGDGVRLYCVAHLVPDATDRVASGHGVTVTGYRTGGPGCWRPVPLSSAGLVLRATVAAAPLLDGGPAAPDGSSRFSLAWLAAVYVGLLALGAGLAAFAATAGRRARDAGLVLLAVVGPPLAPLLLVPWWSRFLVSTFSEPAALVGTAWVAWALLTVGVTRPTDRATRATALGLLAVGGLVATTAKPGFLPVGLVAVAACVVVAVGARHRWRRVPGLVVALAMVALAAVPVTAGLRAQNDLYEVVNADNLAFTAVLPESGPAATTALGLRPEAWSHAGEHFYLAGSHDAAGWAETVAARPAELRSDAYAWLAAHPRVFARMVHRGLVATLRPQVPYLASTTSGPGTVDGQVPMPSYPEGSQTMGPMFVYLDGLPGRWVPPAVLGLALLAAAATLVPGRRAGAVRSAAPVAVGLARAGGALAVTALGIVVLAVLGDGYCEVAKHVWLGSYLLVVTAFVLVGSAVAAGTGRATAIG